MKPRLLFQGLGLEFANTLLDSSPSAGNRTPPAVLKPWGWKVQPLQLFSRPGAGKCNPSWCIQGLGAEPRPCDPSCCFQVLGLESATPPTVLKPCGWKLQPVLLFSRAGAGKCNPSCCFQVLGLANASPLAVLKPWGWKLENAEAKKPQSPKDPKPQHQRTTEKPKPRTPEPHEAMIPGPQAPRTLKPQNPQTP